MFIAVINENFDIAEESKKSRQASHYWASHRPQQARAAWIRKLNPYRWFKAQPKAIEVELPSNLVLPMQKALVQDYGLPGRDRALVVSCFSQLTRSRLTSIAGRIYAKWEYPSIHGEVYPQAPPASVCRRGSRWRRATHYSPKYPPRFRCTN